MGSEVHLDIYDDRLTVTSPGGMYNGALIQDLEIADVSSERRNPILAKCDGTIGLYGEAGQWTLHVFVMRPRLWMGIGMN